MFALNAFGKNRSLRIHLQMVFSKPPRDSSDHSTAAVWDGDRESGMRFHKEAIEHLADARVKMREKGAPTPR